MTPEPLTDSELDSLGNVFKRSGGKQAMNLEQLDGFLAAIICCPSESPETEYLPEIWEDERSTRLHLRIREKIQAVLWKRCTRTVFDYRALNLETHIFAVSCSH
jgi:hypothetical protein